MLGVFQSAAVLISQHVPHLSLITTSKIGLTLGSDLIQAVSGGNWVAGATLGIVQPVTLWNNNR